MTLQFRSAVGTPAERTDVQAQIADLIESHEDQKALRRWRLSLEHRLRLAELKAEYLDAEHQDEFQQIADEVHDFNLVCMRFAAARMEGMR